MRNTVFVVASLAVLCAFNWGIYQKEELKQTGQTVLLELAPVDPRSLMQGDYMRLRYKVEQHNPGTMAPGFVNASWSGAEQPGGDMVITVGANDVAEFTRFDDGRPLKQNEKILHYHAVGSGIHVVPDSFLFQEGQRAAYQSARYGVFKFDDAGHHILTGLADEHLKVLEPVVEDDSHGERRGPLSHDSHRRL